MNCANHPDTAAVAYCRTCGKPLCSNCTRDVQGVIYCETCLGQKMHGATAASPGYAPGVIPPIPSAGPNAALAGILAGLFPFGVGAVYTGQYAKGLAHLVVMTGLIWGESTIHSGPLNAALGIGIAFFYVYQIIDAIKSAHAVRLGQPVPDPFGLSRMFGNEGFHSTTGSAYTASTNYAPGAGAAYVPPTGNLYETPITTTGTGSKLPTGAVILIALGCLFLLHTAGIFNLDFDRIWPLFLIALGGWMLFVRYNNPSIRIGRDGRPCRRRLTGPAVLITVGVLFAIENYSGPDFGRTWPLILLVLGAMRLMEGRMPLGVPAAVPMTPSPAPGGPFPPSPPTSVVYQPQIFPPDVPPASGASSSVVRTDEVKNG